MKAKGRGSDEGGQEEKYKGKGKEENNVSQGSHKEKSSVQLCQPQGHAQSQKGFSRGCGAKLHYEVLDRFDDLDFVLYLVE